ncbi:family 20 glycosylhydrolase [Rubrolithibacter danxiaensis]|uniref:family 20 glycosylhydrolase n=1 Tax=Rubrolithibacter danxiaensis TaxID=3390805 RepID=UPI003BF8FA30
MTTLQSIALEKIIMKKLNKFFAGLFLLLLAESAGAQSGQTQLPLKSTINLMPYPQSLHAAGGKLRITSQFSINLSGAEKDERLEAATNRLLTRLNARTLAYFEQERVVLNEQKHNATLTLQVKTKGEPLPGTDEAYQLSVDSSKASLVANSTIGALRGMETLFQLVGADAEGYYLPEVTISDGPRFRWRGMMVDVARHFLPIDVLKRNIDAMAMVKLNVLHLHLSDDEGFRVESKVFPRLQKFGSKGQYYSQADLKDLVKYASARGIMIYPETVTGEAGLVFIKVLLQKRPYKYIVRPFFRWRISESNR